MSILQYIKDTRSESPHVAWPTRTQTIIYTSLVVGVSLFVSAYLGFFDYVFTAGLSRALQFLAQSSAPIESPISTSTEDIIVGTDSSSTLQVTPTPLEE